LALLAGGLVAACAGGDGTVVRLAHSLDAAHPVHRAMVFMGQELQRASAGRMRLELYPGEQLCSERECLELLQIGSLDMTKSSAAVLESFAPAFRVFGLPYLFRDDAHRFAVLDGEVGAEILASAEPFRLRGLAYYDAGSRSFYTRRRPVRSPADLAGLKIRTQESATAVAMVRALGGAPTPIAWGELYTALQQGVVDGAENNPPSFHLSRHFEVARFYALDEHTAVPDVLLVASATWQRLAAEERRWLTAAARASARRQRQLWRRATDDALAAVEAAGVEVLRPDKRPFADRVQGLYDELRDDPELGPLIERLRAAGRQPEASRPAGVPQSAGGRSDGSKAPSGRSTAGEG